MIAPLPTLNIIPLNFLFSERYLYLPVLGVVLIVTGLVAAAPPRPAGRRRGAAGAVGLALVLFAPLVVARAVEWKDTSSLLHATVRDNPDSPRVMYLHARDLRDRDLIPESLAQCRRALRLRPRFADVWHLAGRDEVDLGREDEALRSFERAVELARNPSAAWLNDYGVALIKSGRTGDARAVLRRAVDRDPDTPRYAENLAQLLLLSPDTRAEGLAALRSLTETHPGHGPGWILRVEAEITAGRIGEAARTARLAGQALSDEAVQAYLAARLREAGGDRAGAARAYGLLLTRDDLDPSLRKRAERARRRVSTP